MYSRNIALLLFSISILLFGTVFFGFNFYFDVNIMKIGLYKIFIYSLLMGVLGFTTGTILDYANAKK